MKKKLRKKTTRVIDAKFHRKQEKTMTAAINAWHGDPTSMPLSEWLGLTPKEYARYVETNELPPGYSYKKRE